MADFADHLNQAKHNLECAKAFLDMKGARDWAITAAFYSAVHFVEAGFTTIARIGHTESVVPDDVTPHSFREKEVLHEYGETCYRNYRKLKTASYNVRYLALFTTQPGIALSYYRLEDASRLITDTLNKVREEVQRSRAIDLS